MRKKLVVGFLFCQLSIYGMENALINKTDLELQKGLQILHDHKNFSDHAIKSSIKINIPLVLIGTYSMYNGYYTTAFASGTVFVAYNLFLHEVYSYNKKISAYQKLLTQELNKRQVD
jgi:hypothetical protein